MEAWRSLPEVISRYYDTNGDWAQYVGLTADSVAMCNALLQSMAARREIELRAWITTYPVVSGNSSGPSSGSDGEGGSRKGGGRSSPSPTIPGATAKRSGGAAGSDRGPTPNGSASEGGTSRGVLLAATTSTTNVNTLPATTSRTTANANVARGKGMGSSSRAGGAATPPILSGGEISLGAPVSLSELDNPQPGGDKHSKSTSVTKVKDARSRGATPMTLSALTSGTTTNDVRSGGVTHKPILNDGLRAGGVNPAPNPIINSELRSGGVTPNTSISVKDVLLAHLQTIKEMLSNPPSASMVNTSNGREAMALARSTTMAPSTVIGGRSEVLHPKLMTDGRCFSFTSYCFSFTSYCFFSVGFTSYRFLRFLLPFL